MQRAREGHVERACFLKMTHSFLQCPNQSGTDWAQMGHRGGDPMGTWCPLHPISSLSHGGAFPLGKAQGPGQGGL